jgi:hypothetical protein
MTTMRLYHGGVPGFRPGDVLTGGQERKHHDGCPYCEARRDGVAHLGIDPLAAHPDIYGTTDRLYAKHYASLWGRGDLYRVELEDPEESWEDTVPSWHAPSAVIVAVLDRAVLLTPGERRRLGRLRTAADQLARVS